MIDDFKPIKSRSGKKEVAKLPEQTDSPEPKFTPPEEMAEQEPVKSESADKTKPKKVKKRRWSNLSRKKKILIIIGIILLITSLSAGAYFTIFNKKASAPAIKTEPAPEPPPPTTEPATLTGLEVPLAQNKLPVTGVIIENSPDARPQAGLKDAGVVFEAIAEGGITRFLALFQHDTTPDYVGPVRSARPYYLDYLQGFDAAIAHVGGSPEALAQIKNQSIKDLDQSANGGSYKRVSNRYAPHNVYTSMANMLDLQKKKGFSSTYKGFARKVEKPNPTPTAKAIDLSISSTLYNVHYDYDAPTNSYLRNEGGKAHMDEKSASQLKPKVVIAMVVPKGTASDRVHSTYQTIGSGKVYIFQDGIVSEGTWKKDSVKTQVIFTDAAGATITLNPGQTWVSLVGVASAVSFKP